MIALARYQLAALMHSQRYLPPVLLFLALHSVLYVPSDEPVTPGFAVTAGALFVVAGWLTIALVDIEDSVQRAITRIHAGSTHRLLIGIALAPLALCGGLIAISLAWGYFAHASGYTATELATGVAAHLVCACAGIALGLPCSRLLVPRFGYALLIALGLFCVVLVVRWVPLIHPLLRGMASGTASAGVLLRSALAVLVTAVASEVLVAKFARD